MKDLNDKYYINSYVKNGKVFYVFTDKKSKEAYSLSWGLVKYLTENAKPVKTKD